MGGLSRSRTTTGPVSEFRTLTVPCSCTLTFPLVSSGSTMVAFTVCAAVAIGSRRTVAPRMVAPTKSSATNDHFLMAPPSRIVGTRP